MKKSLMLLLFVLAIGLGAQSSHAQTAPEKLKQELLQLEKALNVGVKKHDTTALNRILATEYILTAPKFTRAIPRVNWLANVATFSLDSVSISNIVVSNLGEIAVFRSLQHFHNMKVSGQPSPYDEAWATDLWVKRDGRWQLVTRLSERVPKR